MSTKPTNLKQTPIPVVPRTMKIVNPDGTVTRSGQLLLQQLQPQSAIQGTHANRPDPTSASVPDGALYGETDRGVLYFNVGGEWHYAAGTMWGTISPDQRPTDLGANDAGFEFRSIDTNPLLGGHDWIWTGSAWIEITPVRYGGHGTRLSQPLADIWNGMIWVETDRSEVIYQNQSGAWHYCAGTMYGTISPDTRPTDLATNDSGFQFRTTDSPPRQFLWSGTAWVEVTAIVRYGTHAGRPAVTAVADGFMYVEWDRGGVIYQAEAGVWQYLAGTMWGTLSPDQRPTDLGAHDAGFDFRGTDQQRQFIWSGGMWVDVTPKPVTVQASPSRVFGTVYQNTNVTPLFVSVTSSTSNGAQVLCYTDAGNPPGTGVGGFFNNGTANLWQSAFFIVLPNNYYQAKVTAGAASVLLWTEWH
jgi:hypothetical protein